MSKTTEQKICPNCLKPTQYIVKGTCKPCYYKKYFKKPGNRKRHLKAMKKYFSKPKVKQRMREYKKRDYERVRKDPVLLEKRRKYFRERRRMLKEKEIEERIKAFMQYFNT